MKHNGYLMGMIHGRKHLRMIYYFHIREKMFTIYCINRVIRLWNSLPDYVVEADNVDTFKILPKFNW